MRARSAFAARFCAFIECLPHIKGPNARAKESIALEPWQVWIFANAFGWLRKANGMTQEEVAAFLRTQVEREAALVRVEAEEVE